MSGLADGATEQLIHKPWHPAPASDIPCIGVGGGSLIFPVLLLKKKKKGLNGRLTCEQRGSGVLGVLIIAALFINQRKLIQRVTIPQIKYRASQDKKENLLAKPARNMHF